MVTKQNHPRLNFSIILLVLVSLSYLSSCTLMNNAGIEKRKYRPGFFVSPFSSRKMTIHEYAENAGNTTKLQNDLPASILAHHPLLSDTNELAIICTSGKQGEESMDIHSSGRPSEKRSSVISSPIKIKDHFSQRGSLLGLRSGKRLEWGGDGCGDGCFDLAFTLLVTIVAIGIWVLFPAMTPDAAYFLAYLVVFIILAFVFLLGRAMKQSSMQGQDRNHD
jgi:hypothetical protein